MLCLHGFAQDYNKEMTMQNISKYKKIFSKENVARSNGAVCITAKARLSLWVKIISAFTACLLLVLCNLTLTNFITAFADDESNNTPVKTVKVGVFYLDGYHMRDEDSGRLTGYGIEFLNLVSEYSHLNFEYTGYD